MNRIKFSKLAMEDLVKIRDDLARDNLVEAVVTVNKIIDGVYAINEINYSHRSLERGYYFLRLEGRVVFYTLDGGPRVVRVLDEGDDLAHLLEDL